MSSVAAANAAVRQARVDSRLTPGRRRTADTPYRGRSAGPQAKRPVDLLPQVAHIHLDDIRLRVEGEVPGGIEQLPRLRTDQADA